jgi:hypothetical protein
VGFVVCEAALVQEYAHSTPVSPLSIIPPMLRTQSLIFYRRYVSLTVDSVVKQTSLSLSLFLSNHTRRISAMNNEQNEENENGLLCTSADRQLAALPIGMSVGTD